MPKDTHKDEPRCSFCGRTQDDVKKLIAGPGVYICDECINVAQTILDDELEEEEEAPAFEMKELPYRNQTLSWSVLRVAVRPCWHKRWPSFWTFPLQLPMRRV